MSGRIVNPEAVGNPDMEPVVIIDDPTWEIEQSAEHIARLHDLIRQQHDAIHDGGFQWCPNELCQEAQR